MSEPLIKGRELQSRAFPNLLLVVTITDKPAPPAVGITIHTSNTMKFVIIPFPDWPQVVEAVESLRQELEIV
jgi:hypothetical protein